MQQNHAFLIFGIFGDFFIESRDVIPAVQLPYQLAAEILNIEIFGLNQFTAQSKREALSKPYFVRVTQERLTY